MVIELENEPNGFYHINNGLVTNPQADYIENSLAILCINVFNNIEVSLNLTDIKWFTYGLNYLPLDKEIIEAISSYISNSNGQLILKKHMP